MNSDVYAYEVELTAVIGTACARATFGRAGLFVLKFATAHFVG